MDFGEKYERDNASRFGVGILVLACRGDTMCLDSIPSGVGFSFPPYLPEK